MKKRKKRIKRFFAFLFIIIIALVFIYIDRFDNDYSTKEINQKLSKLGYEEESINEFIKLNISNKIIELNKYYKILDTSIKNDSFNEKCLDSYISLDNYEQVYSLCNLEYSNNEITKIFNNLDATEIKNIKTYMSELANYVEYKHFVLGNYDRYIKSEEKDISKKISLVNVNLDYPFYENIKESINNDTNLVLVNKYYKLNNNYPSYTLYNIKEECKSRGDIKLSKDTLTAFEKLCDEAKKEGYTIKASSGYRSYETQRILYNYYLNTDTIRDVDTYSARAGHSEHQTGLAIDIYNGTIAYNKFESTDDYIWAKDNIHKFGFIIRYQKNSEYITGYKFEPWHIRYVGIDVATYIYNNNITLEEYLLNNKVKI